MKSLKKLCFVAFLAALVFGIAGCKNDNDEETQHVHTWNNGDVTTQATCITEGVKTFTCTGCGEKRTESIPAGHKFEEEWSSDETHHWHAASCEHTEEISEKAEHTFSEMTIKDEIGTKTCST